MQTAGKILHLGTWLTVAVLALRSLKLGAQVVFDYENQNGSVGTNGLPGAIAGDLYIRLGQPAASTVSATANVRFYQFTSSGCGGGYAFQAYSDSGYSNGVGSLMGLGNFTDNNGAPVDMRTYSGIVNATVTGTFNASYYYTFNLYSCDGSRPVVIAGDSNGSYMCTDLVYHLGIVPWCYVGYYTGAFPYLVVGPAGLDNGPWPTQDHDNRRSNQSGLSGPASPGTPQLIHDAGSPILSEMVITSDGKLVLGGCVSQTVANQIVAIDATDKPVWPAPYTLVASNNESPMGFTVDASGRIYVAVHDCPDIPGSVPVHLYSVLPNGTAAPNWPIGFSAMYEPPAIAADGTIYQMDELTTLRALRPSDGSVVWTTGFCCFGQGAIALDSAGNLYAAADGDFLGSSGLWSWTPSGALRWTALSGTGGAEFDRLFNTTAISPADIIYVASLSGTVYAFDTNGKLLSGWPFVTGSPVPSDSQRDPLAVGGSGTVYIKTVSAVFAIKPDGTKKWSYSPGGDGSGSPVVILDKDENVYFAFGNTVYSLSATGNFLWSVQLNAPGRLYIGAPGVLYVISGHQQLYAIGIAPQVLLVPGILGTKLEAAGGGGPWLSNQSIEATLDVNTPTCPLHACTDDTKAWNTLGAMAFTSYNTPATSPLTLGPIFSIEEVYPGDPTVPAALSCLDVPESHIDNCAANLFTYNDLYRHLTNAGYIPQPSPSPAIPYGSFPYDWRRDLRDVADDLHSTVVSMRKAYPTRPVAIVAHSMGGLVVMAMLAKYPELYTSGDLADIILLGTPLKGSLKAYATIRAFMSPLDQLFSPAIASRLVVNWPSLYEMMPRWNAPLLKDVRLLEKDYQYSDVYAGNVATDLKQFFPPLMNKAQTDTTKFWESVINLQPYPKAHAIVGVGQATVSRMDVVNELPANSSLSVPCVQGVMGPGDDTVPYNPSFGIEGLWVPSGEFRYVSANHVALPSNPDVLGGILQVLSTGHLPTTPTLLSSANLEFPSQQSFQKCSPIDLTITTDGGGTISKNVRTIPAAQSFIVGDAAQYFVPAGGNYSGAVHGTGTGTFNLFVRQTDSSGNQTVIGSFNNVPVIASSLGTFTLNGGALSNLQYNYAGKSVVDSIPANTKPPTIVCTGCYFVIQSLRATFAFNVGYQGGVSTFTYNYRSPSQTVQFVSTTTSQISVSGNTASFSGQGTLNGQPGYSFAVTAKDGGAAGSGLDTVSITITGPNNYSYTANATVVGGDVVVHQ